MQRIAKVAVAVTVLIALGIVVSWIVIGGASTNIAFAAVAEALDHLQSATFDIMSESKADNGQPSTTVTGKGFFLAPSHQRMEITIEMDKNMQMNRVKIAESPAAKAAAEAVMHMPPMKQVTISDGQADKGIMLHPAMKIAFAMDMKKVMEDMKKSGKDVPPDLFEMVRRIVREGSSGMGDKAERLGKKEIDGRDAVGFRVHNAMCGMGDMTLWADPETARPIHIEITGEMFANVRMVMNNFCYDVDLDPSLFSLKPPEGYSTQAMSMTMPEEEDLLRTLRTVAEHSKGVFPAKLGMSKEIMEAVMKVVKPEMEKFEAKLDAKYGKDKRKAMRGKAPPPEMMAEAMKTMMPLLQKEMQGIQFYMMLKPENDSHYVGGGVKLGTPDRPILWYKPTGADKYRVIYADLSVKELAPEEVKKLSLAK